MPYGKTNGKPAGMADPKMKKKGSPSAKVNMPATPGKSTGKMVNMPNKLGQTKGVKKRNVSAMGSKDPIGPQTKREARKSAPKVPMTSAGTAAAKKQKRRATIAKIGGAIAGVGAGVFDYVRGLQESKGWNKWAYEQQNAGTGKERPSDKELRKLGRGDKKKTK